MALTMTDSNTENGSKDELAYSYNHDVLEPAQEDVESVVAYLEKNEPVTVIEIHCRIADNDHVGYEVITDTFNNKSRYDLDYSGYYVFHFPHKVFEDDRELMMHWPTYEFENIREAHRHFVECRFNRQKKGKEIGLELKNI